MHVDAADHQTSAAVRASSGSWRSDGGFCRCRPSSCYEIESRSSSCQRKYNEVLVSHQEKTKDALPFLDEAGRVLCKFWPKKRWMQKNLSRAEFLSRLRRRLCRDAAERATLKLEGWKTGATVRPFKFQSPSPKKRANAFISLQQQILRSCFPIHVPFRLRRD